MPNFSEQKAIVIIGGGAIGLSLAYHLGKRGAQDVLLLERNSLTSGTSWHAAGIVGPLRATPNMTRLAMYAGTLFPQLEEETGLSTGYRQTGGYWLARERERMDELHRIAALGHHFGLTPELVEPDRLSQMLPSVSCEGLCGVMAVAEDASVNPVDLCMAYARAAKNSGVEIREGIAVSRLLCEDNKIAGIELHDGSKIAAGAVAVCAGAWSAKLSETAGLGLPLQAVEHMYVVTEPRPEFEDFPVLRDLDRGLYIKGDTSKLVIGGFEPDAKCWDAFGPEGNRPFLELAEDWDQFAPFMEAALDLIPSLADTGIQHFMNGPESFTADTRPLIGEAPGVDGLYVAAGMNSVGVMSSAGIGRVLADWMVDDRQPMDLWEVDIARADPCVSDSAHMQARMVEAVADQFTLHWPFKQPKAGRGLRKSALHDRWAAQGAVFGLTAGWERGLWYAKEEAERHLPYSVGDQPWWPIIVREAAQLADGVGLFDLSPFTKIRVEGQGALAQLSALCTSDLDVAPGRAVYSQCLNEHGGIEIEATFTRCDRDCFNITSGAATRWRDLAHLRRHLEGLQIQDLTETSCVIGVMGGGATALLKGLAGAWPEIPFSHSAEVKIGNVDCIATRLSFIGEPGYELKIANAEAGSVFDALALAGAQPMGHYTLEGCRIEKGFLHWGHDIGPEVTPLEAGLGFTIDWSKEFLGKAALEAQRSALSRRLVLCQVEGDPLILHDEPVWEEGHVVGLTTSGGRGARTGLTLAFSLIEIAEKPMSERRFEIEVAGKRYPAVPLSRPPFDPKGERMRG